MTLYFSLEPEDNILMSTDVKPWNYHKIVDRNFVPMPHPEHVLVVTTLRIGQTKVGVIFILFYYERKMVNRVMWFLVNLS